MESKGMASLREVLRLGPLCQVNHPPTSFFLAGKGSNLGLLVPLCSWETPGKAGFAGWSVYRVGFRYCCT